MIWAWIVELAAIRAGSPDERDIYWQTRAGMENLHGTPLARPDSWSWAPVESWFYPTSVGWNMMLGLSYDLLGYWGLFLVGWLAMVCLFWLALHIARRLGAGGLAGFAGMMGVSLLSTSYLSVRATLGVQISLLLALALPLWWEPYVRSRSAVVNAVTAGGVGLVLSVAGQWMHISWLTMAFGVAAAWGAFWLVLPLDWSRRVAVGLSGGLGLVLGVFATPFGVARSLARIKATQQACHGIIVDWMSPFEMGLPQWYVTMAAAIGLAGGLVFWLVRALRSGRRDVTVASLTSFAVLMTPSAVAGVSAMRFTGVSLLVGLPVSALAATGAARRLRRRAKAAQPGRWYSDRALEYTTRQPWLVVFTAVAILLLPAAVWWGPVRHAVPPEADVARALPRGCRLYSTPSPAGAVLLARRDVLVWVDGRADYYGRERLLTGLKYMNATMPTTTPPGATCVLLPTSEAKSEKVLRRIEVDPEWVPGPSASGYQVWERRR